MRWTVVALAALAGCSGGDGDGVPRNVTVVEPGPAVLPTPEPPSPSDRYVGHFVGVEGMFLDVEATPVPHRYKLTMQWDLDHRGTFIGQRHGGEPTSSYISFQRNGRTEELKPTDGAATGLKYLAGKAVCLTVKPGEGYCRD